MSLETLWVWNLNNIKQIKSSLKLSHKANKNDSCIRVQCDKIGLVRNIIKSELRIYIVTVVWKLYVILSFTVPSLEVYSVYKKSGNLLIVLCSPEWSRGKMCCHAIPWKIYCNPIFWICMVHVTKLSVHLLMFDL